MMDSYQYQKKAKAEQRANKKYNPKDFDEADYLLMIIFGFMLVLIVLLLSFSNYIHDKNMNDCERVDGGYEVVGREFAGKTAVDIYGCVK